MKVIGRTENGVILSATNDEVARICGFPYPAAAPADLITAKPTERYCASQRVFRVGVTVEVSPMWDWMTKARESFKKLIQGAAMLRGVADILENTPPLALVEPEEEKE